MRGVALLHDLAFGVVGVGRHAEPHARPVALGRVHDVFAQAGRRADAQDQHAGRQRIERPGMTDLLDAATRGARCATTSWLVMPDGLSTFRKPNSGITPIFVAVFEEVEVHAQPTEPQFVGVLERRFDRRLERVAVEVRAVDAVQVFDVRTRLSRNAAGRAARDTPLSTALLRVRSTCVCRFWLTERPKVIGWLTVSTSGSFDPAMNITIELRRVCGWIACSGAVPTRCLVCERRCALLRLPDQHGDDVLQFLDAQRLRQHDIRPGFERFLTSAGLFCLATTIIGVTL